MKRVLAFLTAFAMVLSLAACGSAPSAPASSGSTPPTSASSSAASNATSSTGDLSDLDGLEVDNNLFDVEITIPADLVGETTQEELEAQAIASGVHSVTLNEDGSATYVMSKAQHAQLMKDLADSINQSLSEMVGSEDYPNVTDISANDDFTVFTVTTTSTELTFEESFSVIGYYLYGGMYGAFAGDGRDNIHVDFVNADSGEIISSSDSSEMGE